MSIDNMLHLVADLLTAVFTHIISYLSKTVLDTKVSHSVNMLNASAHGQSVNASYASSVFPFD